MIKLDPTRNNETKEPQIVAELNLLQIKIEKLESSINHLNDRIIPISRPQYTVDEEKAEKDGILPNLAPLAMDIYNSGQYISKLISCIDGMINSLEI